MLRPRIIPCLLIRNGGLIKTKNFQEIKYLGDPLNAVRIFNEKQVDEIIILDIDATLKGIKPNYQLINDIASECSMPICYGGGIKTLDEIEHLIRMGIEKIALSSSAIMNPSLLKTASDRVGSQSIVVVLDIKKIGLINKSYKIFTHNGKESININLIDLIQGLEDKGVGEIVINSIDRDGTMKGYDMNLMDIVFENTNIPVTALGGAGNYQDLTELIQRYKIIGAAAGSIFVFKGKFKAVLLQYPNPREKDTISLF